MTKNPYDVLGVPQNASDDEIKKAYRDLTRKYHPDANVNNPLADLAEEKFKEVQEAYDLIMKQRASGYNSYSSSSYGSGSSYGGSSYGNGSSYGGGSYGNGSSYGGGSYGNGGYAGQDDPRIQAAINYINNRRYQEAVNTLNQIEQRSAMWYFLSANAHMGMGNNVLARDHAAQAVNMEPNNMQYRQLLNNLNFAMNRYQNSPYGNGYGPGSSSCGTGNMCCDLMIADQLCECMGGDLCSCM